MHFHSGKEMLAAPKLVHLSVYIEVCGANILLILFHLFYCNKESLRGLHSKLKFVLL